MDLLIPAPAYVACFTHRHDQWEKGITTSTKRSTTYYQVVKLAV